MGVSLGRVIVLEALLILLLTTAACDRNKDNAQGGQSSPPFAGPGMPGGAPRPIRGIMNKMGKGPQSLHESLGRELKADPLPWETIQPQAKEYAQLARSLAQYDPPKGSKESWMKATDSFADSAIALERAADSKDKNAVLAAHAQLSKSCMACHREHRGGPGGPPGGPGRPPGGPGGSQP